MLDIIIFLYGDCYCESRKNYFGEGAAKFMARHLLVCNSLIKKISRHFPGGGKLK